MSQVVILLDKKFHEAVRKLAVQNGLSLADQARKALADACGIPFRPQRMGRPPAPWMVVKTKRYGRAIVSRHMTEEAAIGALVEHSEVLPFEVYDAEGR